MLMARALGAGYAAGMSRWHWALVVACSVVGGLLAYAVDDDSGAVVRWVIGCAFAGFLGVMIHLGIKHG